MAVLVAQTRVEAGIHSTLEVVYGGLLGALRDAHRLPDLRMIDDTARALYERRVAITERAYAPYSHFLVGAALRARDGTLFDGRQRRERRLPARASAPSGPRYARAVAEGYRPGDLEQLAITASPCGGCRQWLRRVHGSSASILREQRRRARHVHARRAAAGYLRPREEAGFVAVAGRPNVGKSTLVNALCGGKVAIVSDKPQTTRRRIFGIANGDDYQLVLADLPGFQRPLDALTEHMQRTVDRPSRTWTPCSSSSRARERIGAGDRFIAPRLRARRARRDRAEQGRPAEAGAHRDADHDRARSSATSMRCTR